MKGRRRLGAVLAILLLVLLALIGTTCGVGAWLFSRYNGRLPGSNGTPEITVHHGGELHLFGQPPVTLDPALVEDSYSAAYVVEIFSGLVTLDRNLNVVPDLAERWDVSPDGRTYTFYLRPNTTFQDGKPVTAADFKYSLERACSPALASPAARSYLGDIVGAIDMIEGRASSISGVRVLDDHRLSITIDAPKAYFLAKLTYSTAFVVDRTNVESGANWTEHPNGTGPFRLSQHNDQQIVLEPNTHYYGTGPSLDRVTFLFSGGSPVDMYENGQLDIAYVGLDDIDRVQDPTNMLSHDLTVAPQLDVQYLAMNVNEPPFDDIKVRRAFAEAIDREKLAKVVLKDTGVAATGILPPGMPGYNTALQGLPFDPEQARKLLQESRYKDAAHLPQVVLDIAGESDAAPPTIEAIVAMLHDNLGVNVRVEQMPWDQFLTALDQRQFTLFSSGWIADYPDPQDFIDILFDSQSHDNQTGYRNPQVDQLLQQARVEQNRDARLRLYQQAEAMIVQDAPWIPLWHSRDYVLVKPYVKGAVFSAAVRPWLKDVSVDR